MCAGTKGPEMDIYIYLCVLLQEANYVKRVIKSLIIGTTSRYIGRVRKCATDCSRIPYLVLVWVRNARTRLHLASCIPEFVDHFVAYGCAS